MRHKSSVRLVALSALLVVHFASTTQAAPAPTRSYTDPGAPPFKVIPGSGAQVPTDVDGNFVIGPDYPAPPEANTVDGVPQGSVQQFILESTESRFYPGVARDGSGVVDPDNPRTLIVKTHPQPYQRTITVYIPKQYKPDSQAAPFIVMHDGPKSGESDTTVTHILDSLIAQRRVPVMLAVMIQNGGGDAQGSERGLEYDTLSGRFAEYIEAEVLPAVEKTYSVKLTRKPEGRAVMGCSSGAAAAFTMAWFHPEWYQRVISYSGTFVNQQWPFNPDTPGGAWEYHASLIPHGAPKPIRIWMQAGDRDLFNPNTMRDGMHDWVEANHRMATVLKLKGYSYQYVFALNSAHCDRTMRYQTLPEALEWVWKGYPTQH